MALVSRKTILSSLAAIAFGVGASAALTPVLAQNSNEGNRANKPGIAAYMQVLEAMRSAKMVDMCMTMREVFDAKGKSLGSGIIDTCPQ